MENINPIVNYIYSRNFHWLTICSVAQAITSYNRLQKPISKAYRRYSTLEDIVGWCHAKCRTQNDFTYILRELNQ